MNESELRSLLDDLQRFDVESDAMSRLVVTRLARQNIRHRPMLGRVEWQGKALAPHFWVEVGDWIIDYCADHGLDEQGAPLRGVLPRAAVGGQYQGQQIVIDPWPDYLCRVFFKTDKAAA